MRFGEGSNALSCYGYYCRGTIARCYGGEGMRSFRAKEYLILIRSGQGAAFRASMPCPPFMNRFAIGPSLKGRHGYTKGGNVMRTLPIRAYRFEVGHPFALLSSRRCMPIPIPNPIPSL